jgi:hypothetical protein
MKLAPLIYSEAAKTATNSLDKGIFAFHKTGRFQKVVLFSSNRLLDVLASTKEKVGKGYDTSQTFYGNSNFLRTASVEAGKRAIAGAVGFHDVGEEYYKVDTSSGVANFGPLAYQIAMYAIGSGWLMSDLSLKPASRRVWSNMYKLSEQGVYERQYLGEFNIEAVMERCEWSSSFDAITTYIRAVEDGETPHTEEAFLSWLKETLPHVKPEDVGNFWAYRKRSHDPMIQNLFDRSKEFVAEAETKFGIPEEAMQEIMQAGSNMFFSRLYSSAATK